MRICLVATGFPPGNFWGIDGSYAYELACGLKKAGHAVEVITLSPDASRSVRQDGFMVHTIQAQFEGIAGELGVISQLLPNSKFVFQTSCTIWKKFTELHEQRPFDLVDCPEILACGLMPYFTKTLPVVVRLSGPPSKLLTDNFHKSPHAFDDQLVEMARRHSVLSADAIISPSIDLTHKFAYETNCPESKIETIKHPINPHRFNLPEPKERHKPTIVLGGWQQDESSCRVLKGIISEVLKQVAIANFVIVGDDDFYIPDVKGIIDYTDQKKDITTSPGRFFSPVEFSQTFAELEANVTYMPNALAWHLLPVLRNADLCILDLKHAYAPYLCLKALSCGKPVIALPESRASEYIEHNQTGIIVSDYEPAKIARLCLTLLKEEGERKRLAKNARESVLEHFSYENAAARTINVYNKAQAQFAHKQALYYKGDQNLIAEAEALYLSLDQLLYNFRFVNSLEHRVSHWITKIAKNPSNITRKVMKKTAVQSGS